MAARAKALKKPEKKENHAAAPWRNSAVFRTRSSPQNSILFFQQTAGNQMVRRFMQSGALAANFRAEPMEAIREQEAAESAARIRTLKPLPAAGGGETAPLLNEFGARAVPGPADLVQRQPKEEEKQPQIFGRSPPGVGDYVPDRPTIPIKEPEHKLIKEGATEYTYDEWIVSQLGRSLNTTERNSFERGCVGLMLLRLGYPDKSWPWEIPGSECWLTETKALQRQKDLKTQCSGFPPAMYAFQSDGGWKPGKEPNQKQIKGEEPVDPNNVRMAFMPDPDYNLWNFATRHKDAWEWMNHAKTYSTAAKPWRVRVRSSLPSDLGSGKDVTTLFGLACPKPPSQLPNLKAPPPQPNPPQIGS